MSRVKRGVTSRAKHKSVLKMAKGFRGRSSTCIRIARERVEKGLAYAYRDRKNKKRVFRSIWIQRVNASVRALGLKYSTFMNGMKNAGIQIDRRMLAKIAFEKPDVFSQIVDVVKASAVKN